MSINLKIKIKEEWILYLFEIIVITFTFFYSLGLFRSCDCCPITKIMVHTFLILGMLLSGIYLIYLTNELDTEKIISILHRFQYLKLFIFLLIVASWIMMIIISAKILKICGNEKDSNIHINNFKNCNTDTQIVWQRNVDTIYIASPNPVSSQKIINNYFNNKKDTIIIVNKIYDSVSHYKYITLLKDAYSKVDSLEKSKFSITYHISAAKFKLKRNKFLNESFKLELFKIDSLNIDTDKVEIKRKKYNIYSELDGENIQIGSDKIKIFNNKIEYH